MRVRQVVGVVLAVACVCLPSIEGSRWASKKRRQEEDKQANKLDDSFDLSRKLSRSAGSSSGFDSVPSSLKDFAAGAESLDVPALIKDTIGAFIEQLEDPAQRAQMSKEGVIELLQSLPEGDNVLSGYKGGVSALIKQLEEYDGRELQKKMDTALDSILEHLKATQRVLEQPDGLQQLMRTNLKAAGMSDSDIDQALEVLSNPEAMAEAMTEFAQQAGGLFDDLSDEDVEQLQKALADPDALAEALEELMSDEEMQKVLGEANLDELMAGLQQDPEIQAAIEGAKSSKRGTKRGADDAVKRTARRQRA